MISPDAPINRSDQDKLGRTQFATALAKRIFEFASSDSFVIAINGNWGTGKTSVLNLCLEQIENLNGQREERDHIHVLKFNPWYFADQSQLILQFLRQFRAHVSGFKSQGRQKLEKLVAYLGEYADAVAPPLELIPAGRLAGALYKVGIKKAQSALGQSRDIQKVFEEISTELVSLRLRTVVLIDDIDRLTAPEIRQVFQLVKLSARFPNVVYILSFDRAAVAKALEKELNLESGDDYLEKIVQLSFDLPPISQDMLNRLITSSIDDLLQAYPTGHFDTQRFGHVFHGGFKSFFSSLRDVRRFINGLEFGFGMIGKEVNGVDFIGVEALRTFYPEVFDIVRSNGDLFAGHIDTLTRDKGADAFREKVDAALRSTKGFGDNVKELLIDLFPKLEFAYRGVGFSGSDEDEWEKSYRVASTRYFDVYFELVLSGAEVSVAEITDFVAGATDSDRAISTMVEFQKSGRLANAADSIRPRLSGASPEGVTNILRAFLNVADSAKSEGGLLFGHVSEYWHVRRAIFDCIDRLPEGGRYERLADIFETGGAYRTTIQIYGTLKGLRDKKEQNYRDISDSQLDAMKDAISRSVVRARESGILMTYPYLIAPLRFLEMQGRTDKPTDVLDAVLDDPSKLATLLDSLIHQVQSAGLGDRIVKQTNRVYMVEMLHWYSAEQLLSKFAELKARTVDRKSKEVFEVVEGEILSMRKKNWTPEQYDGDQFMD